MRGNLKNESGRVIFCVTVDTEDCDVQSLLSIKEVCRAYNAPVTWFVLPQKCNEPEVLGLLSTFVEEGDEAGLHIEWDGSFYVGLKNIPIESIRRELEDSMEILSPWFRLKSFRGGGLSQTTPVLDILEQKGFKFDSSVAYKLDDSSGWRQGHNNVYPVSAYYPSSSAYDVIASGDSGRSSILEIPVTRAMPSPKFWCNMLEPGIVPVWIMKLTFRQYYERRSFQPLVLLVSVLHSWSPKKHPRALSGLGKILDYMSKHDVEFGTVEQAGYEWERIWEGDPSGRDILLAHQFNFGLKTRLKLRLLKLVTFVHNLRIAPVYNVRALLLGIYDNFFGKSSVVVRVLRWIRR